MRVVISVNPHEGMCRLEMKLHGYVLINAISFHQRWLLWHFVPSKRGDKTDRFRSCQIRRLIYCSAFKVRYQCQPESVRIRLAISGSKTDNWRLKNDKKTHQRTDPSALPWHARRIVTVDSSCPARAWTQKTEQHPDITPMGYHRCHVAVGF